MTLLLLYILLFYISILNCSLLEYRNAIYFCILTLYSITSALQSLLISTSTFCNSLVFFTYASNDSYFYFSNLMPFISSSSILALASSTMLNRNGKNRHPCLVSYLGKVFKFFITKYNVNCRFFVCNLYIMFRKFPFIPCFAENFFMNWC